MVGAGIRWGLNDAHRSDLGLGACGDQNSAWFGLRRMLLGYASGAVPVPMHLPELDTIEPYAEVGGLEAELAGSLAHLLQALVTWWAVASTAATPAIWAQRCRSLLADMARCTTDPDKQALRALEDGLVTWQDACEASGFAEDVSLVVAGAAWLEAVETPSLNQRFRAGGVTFCTLMPMRAIPFEVVCLLGMNDGDYPRRGNRSDFDLMGLPGNNRPGDRSRREDDRQLMLEALLSARQVFYVSWCGRSVRDNSEQPPSVLVSQLRDYLSSGWGKAVVTSRTTQHPLQPFSRQYFEEGSTLLTYAREWRSAHATLEPTDADGKALPGIETMAPMAPMSPFVPAPNVPLTLSQLTSFLRNPVKAFFRQRLQVVFDETPDEDADDESFGVDGLQQYGLLQDLLTSAIAEPNETQEQLCVQQSLAKLRKSGDLPLKVFGDIEQQALEQTLSQMLSAWRAEQATFPHSASRQSVRYVADAVVLEDWVDHLRSGDLPPHAPDAQDARNCPVAWLELQPNKLLFKVRGKHFARPEKLLGAWVRSLATAASGALVQGVLVGRDGVVRIPPVPQAEAVGALQDLLQLWLDGMNAPLPLPSKTALALVAGKDAVTTYEGGYMTNAEAKDACLARMYPDYDALTADGRFEDLAHVVYGPLLQWAQQLTAEPHATQEEGQEVAA
jgi:exodeoxyribonuclease V gamma subunit